MLKVSEGFGLPSTTRFFSYKNILYKNIEAEICQKSKNILRIFEAQIREDSLDETNQLLQRL